MVLRRLRARIHGFRPLYDCPLCRQVLEGPPIICRGLPELHRTITQLSASAVTLDEEESEDVEGLYVRNFKYYFMFSGGGESATEI